MCWVYLNDKADIYLTIGQSSPDKLGGSANGRLESHWRQDESGTSRILWAASLQQADACSTAVCEVIQKNKERCTAQSPKRWEVRLLGDVLPCCHPVHYAYSWLSSSECPCGQVSVNLVKLN